MDLNFFENQKQRKISLPDSKSATKNLRRKIGESQFIPEMSTSVINVADALKTIPDQQADRQGRQTSNKGNQFKLDVQICQG